MARTPKSPTRTPRPKDAASSDTTAVAARAPEADTRGASPRGGGATAPAGLVDGDSDATVLRAALRPVAPAETRKHTLATAIARAAGETPPPQPRDHAAVTSPRAPVDAALTAPVRALLAAAPVADEMEDAVVDEVDEWSAADQPTIYLPPRAFLLQRLEPVDASEGAARPPRPSMSRDVPGRAAPPLHRAFALGDERLAAPDGRIAPIMPPPGVPRAALANPRMERFQELRQHRMTLDPEQREAEGKRPVTESVRQWWGDLLPGVERALRHQREARTSGVHPLSPHDETPMTRLGDAFGRLSTSARQITQRTQAAVTPTLRRIHDQAEQRAQAFVERIEGSAARQQAPLLGPGRIAVFFNSGVPVSLAQALLANHQARPIRLIPRKHGFLAVVRPGAEAEVAERLRYDEHVRDVAYLEFDEYGEPIDPR